VEFKKHLAASMIVNSLFWLFWLIWFFKNNSEYKYTFPWPIWPMLGSGIGLFFSSMGAYAHTKETSVQKEYQKLKEKMQS